MIIAGILIAALFLLTFLLLHINFYRIRYFNIRKEFKGRSNPLRIGRYYDQWKKEYCEFYGEIIQAHRSENTDEMLEYIMNSAMMKENERLLDAGCGFCGPAVFFASHVPGIRIDAITISQEQVAHSVAKVAGMGLGKNVNVFCADYHFPERIAPPGSYDLVYFLESYGHATRQQMVLKKAIRMMKPGGRIYIKDYFMSEHFFSFRYKRIMQRSVRNMNREYRYNLPDLYQTLFVLRRAGLELVFLRKPSFSWNKGTTVIDFERKNNIDLFKGMETIQNVDVFEMMFRKPL